MTRRFACFALLALPALLAACGTPQERCIRSGTEDLRTLNSLIAESEATLSRGYALVEVETTRMSWENCGWHRPRKEGEAPQPRMCWRPVPDTETRPVSVNLDAERAKLVSMQRKHRSLQAGAAPVIAACKAQFPE
ncbi:hypothetical protein [Falsigemmobacter faecalis]|uniref:Excinuclease ABC subunit B n=1 Tax=Falsigemmobacter faecalis TaxID=2488730 RepID=A0A3P3DV00_9RHOB|nr:hypothetical protein [Falsigemmobacter faecalis]RRH77999.1 hypothetical protein EG244_02970 [Falsigemmobacter faecalis]